MNDTYKNLHEFLSKFHEVKYIDWKRIAPFLKAKHLGAGEYFQYSDQTPSDFAFVETGLFRCFHRSTNGSEHINNFVQEHELLGSFSALFTRLPSELNIQALEPSSIFSIDYNEFRVVADAVRSLDIASRRFVEYLYCESEKKNRSLQTCSVREHYEKFAAKNADLMLRVPQFMIASYLGISPVSLSRIVHEDDRVQKKKEGPGLKLWD